MKTNIVSLLVAGLLAVVWSPLAAAQYTSPNYQVNEYLFGAGGELDASSPNYKAQSAVGNLGVGNSSSSTYQAYSGFLTPNEPFLELGIDSSIVNLGTLDTSCTRTGVATFHVRAYVNNGYTVQTVSNPPTMTSGAATHTLNSKTSQGATSVGTEEFGINLVGANNLGSSDCAGANNFGSNPSPQPDSSFANGQAASGYSTTNQFKYNSGDVIACSGVSAPCGSGSGWGLTNYTISYMANIAPLTQAGSYRMIHDLVAVPTY